MGDYRMPRFAHIISAIDMHTAGEPTRIVLNGLPPIPGTTMAAKKNHMMRNLDYLRTLLMQEPRGHRDMFGVVLTPPATDAAQYGVIFMDNAGYIDMCGHGIMALTTALIETGTIAATEPETQVSFDTPAGLVRGCARIVENRVSGVSVANVSSFLYAKDIKIVLPDIGEVGIDVSYGGNFFALVPAKALNVAIQLENIPRLIELGMLVKKAINEKIEVRHPINHHIARVELTEIYEKPDPSSPFSQSVTIFGNGQLDRCPCGTGTSAMMAARHAKGELAMGTLYTNESIIGTRFRGKLIREVKVGDFMAVDPVVTGEAYMTGIQQFVVDPHDPLKYGFTVG